MEGCSRTGLHGRRWGWKPPQIFFWVGRCSLHPARFLSIFFFPSSLDKSQPARFLISKNSKNRKLIYSFKEHVFRREQKWFFLGGWGWLKELKPKQNKPHPPAIKPKALVILRQLVFSETVGNWSLFNFS